MFGSFGRWQSLRVVVQVLNFGAMLWALVAYVSVSYGLNEDPCGSLPFEGYDFPILGADGGGVGP